MNVRQLRSLDSASQWVSWTIRSGLCSRKVSLSAIEQVQKGTRQVIKEIAAETGATVLDVRNFFCAEGTCYTQRGHVSLYLDDIHISVAASQALVPNLMRVIKDAAE